MLNPPKDLPPEKLFRLLLGLPRPELAIAYRIPGSNVPLSVRAVSSFELSLDAPELVALALQTPDGNAFNSGADVCHVLTDRALGRLSQEIHRALAICSPCDGFSDWDSWQQVLLQGARHYTNQRDAFSLGGFERPDLFFGVAPINLIDAHYFVWRASRTFYLELTS